MKLLLDEHYSPIIAEKLRDRGHDVISVNERPDLIGRDDHHVCVTMMGEQRAILTENWADFNDQIRLAAQTGSTHFGVLFTSPRSMPRGRETIGLYVRVLDDFLKRHEPLDALADNYAWLPDRQPAR